MAETRQVIEAFVLDTLLLGDTTRSPSHSDSLIESGIIDSTGVLELIEFLEEEFEISIDETETTPQNLDSIDRVVEFVSRKRG